MEKILINLNKCRVFGIPICDDPINKHSPLGIEGFFYNHIDLDIKIIDPEKDWLAIFILLYMTIYEDHTPRKVYNKIHFSYNFRYH